MICSLRSGLFGLKGASRLVVLQGALVLEFVCVGGWFIHHLKR